jgi:ABC-type lipoprotein release transport system permease subunit
MHGFLEIAWTGLVAVVQYPLRSLATVGCLVAVLLPYMAGLGLSKGLESQAENSVRHGADLYVTAEQLGRPVPIAVAAADDLRHVDGVQQVVPRIVARVVLRGYQEDAVLVGIPSEHFPAEVTCVEGRLPRKRYELVLGTDLARRIRRGVGDLIPPFYHNDAGDRICEVVGIFRSDDPIWQSNLILTTFETASAICNQHELATDLLVYCRPGPGYADNVGEHIRRLTPPPAAESQAKSVYRVTTRSDLKALLPQGLLHREGIFNLHFVLVFVVGILTILVTSGMGTYERRRETGILKATGWQTDEVLFRSLVESLILSLAGAALAVILAFVWLRWANGYWIASIFLPGVGVRPGFPVPFRLTPVPVLLAFVISLALVLTGTLYSTWRAAVVPPRDAMR